MSTRLEVPHPVAQKQKLKFKGLPTMSKEGKFRNMMEEQDKVRQHQAASNSNRMTFLKNQLVKNKLNEHDRLTNTLEASATAHANPTRFKLPPGMKMKFEKRKERLKEEARNAHAYIGPEARYHHIA